MYDLIVQNTVTSFFVVLQGLTVIVIGNAFRMHVEIKELKKDMNHAFEKIRDLKDDAANVLHNQALEAPGNCSKSGKR